MRPLIESLAAEGFDPDKIAGLCKKHIDSKIRNYYRKIPLKIGEIIKNVKFQNADSKAEAVLYNMLEDSRITFKFHYKIGPYEADYLVGKNIVLELDGPLHTKKHDDQKDRYLRRMGYRVLRVPIWVLSMEPEVVLQEIQGAI